MQKFKFQVGTIYHHNYLDKAWGKLVEWDGKWITMQLYPNHLAVFAPYEINNWTLEGVITPKFLENSQSELAIEYRKKYLTD
jgi:hypothetical protein